MSVFDWLVFEAGPYLLAAWTLVLVGSIVITLRAEWQRVHTVSPERINAVREWAGDYRMYVPADWDREPTR